ncbi:NDP-sugar synthase [Patescibacteria group bacterium]
MKVILLAGGSGERLKSLTKTISKPMMPINGRPVISYLLEQLSGHDVIVITKNVFVEQYEPLQTQYDFTIIGESEQRGTGGALDLMRDEISETFCVSNADEIKRIDMDALKKFHLERGGVVTFPVKYLKDSTDYGFVEFSEDSMCVTKFTEKVGSEPGWVSVGGPYMCEPDIFAHIPENTKSSLEVDVFPSLAAKKLVYAYVYDGPFHTIDDPKRYQDTQDSLPPKINL